MSDLEIDATATAATSDTELVNPPAASTDVPHKFPLMGMPFDRDDLTAQTRREFDIAKRKGAGIGWSAAKRRAYRSLILKHFPTKMWKSMGRM